jgi:hypothetical protein
MDYGDSGAFGLNQAFPARLAECAVPDYNKNYQIQHPVEWINSFFHLKAERAESQHLNRSDIPKRIFRTNPEHGSIIIVQNAFSEKSNVF